MGQIVQFARGDRSVYNSYTPEQKLRKIFFAQDTNEIIVNNVVYGVNLNALDLDILATVIVKSPGVLEFTKTNGTKVTVQAASVATETLDGLLSKEDKKIINEIPSTYATKEELKESTIRIYRFKGTKQYFSDLPTEGQIIGDTYNILNSFEIGDSKYPAGTNVAWDGSNWDPLGGEDAGYSKAEANEKFVPWTVDSNNKKLIILPQGSKIIGTKSDGDGSNLVQLGIYENGTVQQVEVGSIKEHLCLNSLNRPTLDLPNGVKENLAYVSDIGTIDLNSYPETAVLVYIPSLEQEFIDSNGNPQKVNGEDYNAVSNPYKIGNGYIMVTYQDSELNNYYDLFDATSIIPNATYSAIESLRTEYLDMLTWEDA